MNTNTSTDRRWTLLLSGEWVFWTFEALALNLPIAVCLQNRYTDTQTPRYTHTQAHTLHTHLGSYKNNFNSEFFLAQRSLFLFFQLLVLPFTFINTHMHYWHWTHALVCVFAWPHTTLHSHTRMGFCPWDRFLPLALCCRLFRSSVTAPAAPPPPPTSPTTCKTTVFHRTF